MYSTLQLILSWILLTLLMPIIAGVFLPLKIYKTIVVICARIFRRDLGSFLTSYDSIFAIDDFDTKPYAGNVTCIIVDGNLGIQTLRNGFMKNIMSVRKSNGDFQFGKLLQIPVNFGGYFFWSNLKSVNIEEQITVNHVFHSEDHEAELMEVMAGIMTKPLHGALWEILTLEKYNRNQTVIVFRLHHVLGDGYTFNHLIDRLIGKQSEYLVRENKWTWKDKLSLLVSAPSHMIKMYCEAFTHKDIYTRRKVNTTGVLSMTTLDLDLMKKVRRASDVHFATLGMSLLAGAIRRYFLENNKEEELPPWIGVMHSLPRAGHPITEMVNHWGVGLFKMPLKYPTALTRLKSAEDYFSQYIQDQYRELIHSHIPMFNLLPASLIKLFFSTNFGTGMGFTSVPGYSKQADIFGHRVTMMYKIFGLQWKETAIAAAVYTQNSHLGFTILANKDILPDQEAVDRVTKDYLHQEFRELLKECGIKENNNQTEIMTIPQPMKRSVTRAEGFA